MRKLGSLRNPWCRCWLNAKLHQTTTRPSISRDLITTCAESRLVDRAVSTFPFLLDFPTFSSFPFHFAFFRSSSRGPGNEKSKMAALAGRSRSKLDKSYFLALRSALKSLRALSRTRHTKCTVEVEVGSQWVSEWLCCLKKINAFCTWLLQWIHSTSTDKYRRFCNYR